MIHLVVPDAHEGRPGSGQWKDLQGIRLVLGRIGTEWSEFRFDGVHLDELAAQIGGAPATVVWYYTFWPEALEELKRRCPQARIVLRTVNAEALQHWTRAGKDWRRLRGLPRDIYGFFRLLARDRRSAGAADALAGISPWDDARYWARLAGAEKVRTAPYFCPWPELETETQPQPWAARENIIACLPGFRDVIGQGHIDRFAVLARGMESRGRHFVLSGGFTREAAPELPPNVEHLGFLEKPWELLCRVKAVAVLSPFGHGCKTTVADALAAGCHVLMDPRQHARLPREEQAQTLAVDVRAAADLARIDAALRAPPQPGAETVWHGQVEHSCTAWRRILLQ